MDPLVFVIPAGVGLLVAGSLACRRWGYIALAGALPLLGVITVGTGGSLSMAFAVLMSSLTVGCVTGLMYRYDKTIQYLIVFAPFIITALVTGQYYYFERIKGIDMVGIARDGYVQNVQQSPDFNEDMKKAAINQINEMYQLYQQERNTVPVAMFFFIIALMSTWLGSFIVKVLFRLIKVFERRIGIERFRLNDYLIFALIASIGVYALTQKRLGTVHLVAVNVLFIVSFFYFVQGLGIAKHVLLKKGFPAGIILTVFAVTLYFGGLDAVLFEMMIFAGLGALDLWGDFRGLKKKIEGDGGNSGSENNN
jgi:hypothetical protein